MTYSVLLLVLTYTICAGKCSLNRQELDQTLESYVHKSDNLEEPVSIKILVAGKSGVGKSTIINALVGMDVAKTNDDVVSATEETERVVAVKNGVHIYVTDIPDFDMKGNDTLHGTLNHGEDIDLFLFCLKMTERLDHYHMEGVKAITNIFGADIWQKGLFVLTFANEINEEHFSLKLDEWESGIRRRIKKIINSAVAEKIPIVPTGFKKSHLPDRPNWLSELLIQGIGRMSFKARLYVAVLNVERIGNEIDEKKFAEKMCKSLEDQPLMTQYLLKQERKGRWISQKLIIRIGYWLLGSFFLFYAITIRALNENHSVQLGICAGSCVVMGWWVGSF